jgi:chromosome segregation ATPase
MMSWAAITPQGGPRDVEQARARLDQLSARIGTERDRIEQSKRDLAAAEQADRDKMAAAFAAGNEPTSDVRAIEKLRSAVGEAERRAAALDTAIAAADEELGQAVAKHRDKWAADTEQAIEKHRQQARAAHAQLAETIAEMNQLNATASWLAARGGADEGRPPKARQGTARSSARWAANGEAVHTDVLLAWVAELVEPAVIAEPVLDVVA